MMDGSINMVDMEKHMRERGMRRSKTTRYKKQTTNVVHFCMFLCIFVHFCAFSCQNGRLKAQIAQLYKNTV